MLKEISAVVLMRMAMLAVVITAGLWDESLFGIHGGSFWGPFWGGLHALAMATLGAYAALALARRLVDSRPRLEWCCAAGVIHLWLAVVLFWALAFTHHFTRGWAVSGWALFALAARFIGDRDRTVLALALAGTRDAAGRLGTLARGRLAPLVWIAGALIIAHLARALLSPPVNWDGLTYHLVKAGRWVQAGGLAPLHAPDAWSYYGYFPGGGDVLSAWAMLPFHGDLLVSSTNAPLIGLVFLAFLALARRLGADSRLAVLGGLSLVLMPSVFFELRTVLVDIGHLAEVLCGLLFTLRAMRTRRPGDALVAAAAFGLAVGTKSAALPIVLGVLLVAVVFLVCRPAFTLVLLSVLAVPCAPWLLRAGVDHGSPLYPLPVRLGGLVLSRGSPAFTRLLEGANTQLDDLLAGSSEARARYRQVFGREFTTPLAHHARLLSLHATTPGPLALLALLLAPLGALALWRRGRRLEVLLPGLVALLIFTSFLAPDLRGMRFWWIAVTGRFLAPALAIALLLGLAWTTSGSRLARLFEVALGSSALASCFADMPLDWVDLLHRDPMGFAMGAMAAAAGVAILLSAARMVFAMRSGWPATLPAVVLTGAALALLPALDRTREQNRYPAYGRMQDQESTWYRVAIPAWTACDDPSRPRRIACAAGYDGVGHNWFWYPLMGRRLQNHVDYVPVTRDGRVIDYARVDEVARRASEQAWLKRLVAREIDTLVTLPPPPLEARWAEAHPEWFTPEVRVRGVRVWRFDRQAAHEALRKGAEEANR